MDRKVVGFFVSRFLGAVAAAVLLSVATHAEQAEAGTNEFPALWFPVGEELIYRLSWGFIPIGRTRVSTGWIEEDGRPLLAIRYRTLTNALFDRLYPMNDYAESIIDPDGFRSVRFTFVKARRKVVCNETMVFDYEAGQAHYSSTCGAKPKAIEITPDVRDIIAFMYHLRRDGLPVGVQRPYRVMGNDGLVDLHIETSDGGRMDLPLYGAIPCMKVVPTADFSGLLIEKGKVTAWVSKDDRRLATRMLVRAPVANVRAVLCRVLGPGDDEWTRRMGPNGDAEGCDDEADVPPPADSLP